MKNLFTTILLVGSLHAGDIFPLGTIMHSLLDESDFQSSMGTEWIPLDGRDIRTTDLDPSKYGVLNDKGELRLPDARGKFLRILDTRAIADENRTLNGDPEARTVGSYQGDEFKSHNHKVTMTGARDYSSGAGSHARAKPASHTVTTTISGGSETRPKNIAVTIYIKAKQCQSTQCK